MFTTAGDSFAVVQHDLGDALSAIATLERSPDPFSKAVGVLWSASHELFTAGSDASLSTVQRAMRPVVEMPESIRVTQFFGLSELVAGWANAYLGSHDQALRSFATAQTLIDGSAPDTTASGEMLASAGFAHIALGDPVAALPLADRLDDFDYFKGEEIRAAAHLALGDLDTVVAVIRDQRWGLHASDTFQKRGLRSFSIVHRAELRSSGGRS